MVIPKSRENPVIMKLESPEFRSIFTDELKALIDLFKKYNYEIRVAGGAVRDLLMNLQPKDLDFATTATPTEMKKMFETENIRMINMNGEKHGTITPRINDKQNFEVTTLRIDLVTDGRHAEVQFTTDWLLDALRRDLTINSLFLDFDGHVYDYFYGYDDLKNRRLVFVGSAVTRIQEDYLRILRYFRFYGRIAVETNKHEEEILKAIRDNAEGLKNISGERMWTELKKILEGNFAGDLLETIIKCGLSEYIGLPENPNIDELRRVWARSKNLNMNGITLLSSILNHIDEAEALHRRLKLSTFDRDLVFFIVNNREPKLHPSPLLPYQQIVAKTKSKPSVIKQYVLEVLKYNNSPYLQEMETWENPKFPINGTILKEKGVEPGKVMGVVMQELKNIWVDSEFKLDVDELLSHIPKILNELKERKKSKG
ncbi:CCA tRNA nucleotidyltransferase 1, mitochondrial isoform X2 [Sitophilus oryzae]|nr:CCA tRNA nucleotidyltransferase 1, mitochondrial isoform X2 [Sitophilus oryzae]